MKEQITYLELLELIRDGKAPLQIKYNDNIYKYKSCQYGYLIRDLFKKWNDYGLARRKCIEIISSEEENNYCVKCGKKINDICDDTCHECWNELLTEENSEFEEIEKLSSKKYFYNNEALGKTLAEYEGKINQLIDRTDKLMRKIGE